MIKRLLRFARTGQKVIEQLGAFCNKVRSKRLQNSDLARTAVGNQSKGAQRPFHQDFLFSCFFVS